MPPFPSCRYYLFTICSSNAGALVAVHIYHKYYDGETKLPAGTTWSISVSLVAAWAATFAFFTTRIANATHVGSFWSTTTTKQWVKDLFLEGDTDEIRIQILEYQRLFWEAELGAKVKSWTMANWEVWDREQPAWFTPYVKSTVPDDYIPPQFLAGLGGGNRERRGSASQRKRSVREVVKESARRMSILQEPRIEE
jgi:hypothetical protein